MPPVSLPYLDRRIRNGRDRWYFRHPSVPRTRVPGQPGEPLFQRTYSRLLDEAKSEREAEEQRRDSASIRSLVDLYRSSDEWLELRDKTRRDYGRELDRLCDMAGDLPFDRLTSAGVRELRKRVKADVVAAREMQIARRAEQDAKFAKVGKTSKRKPPKPTTGAAAADAFKRVLSALMGWAVENEHIDTNPANGAKRLHKKRNVVSYKPWTEHQLTHAILHGPRAIRDGVVLGAYTGQRLGDCCRMGKSHCVGPLVRIRQHKTGNLVDVRAVGPLSDLILERKSTNSADDASELLLQDDGKPYSERLFSEHLRDWLDEQGWTDVSFHGLRYAAAGTLNEAGATVATICSIIGHSTYQMALKYLSAREDQARAADLLQQAADRRAGVGN